MIENKLLGKNILWKSILVVGIIFFSFASFCLYNFYANKKARDLYYNQEMYRFYEHSSYLTSCWSTNKYGISMDNEEFYSNYKKNNQEMGFLREKMHQDGYTHWEIKKIERAAQEVLKGQKDFDSKHEFSTENYFTCPEGRLLCPDGNISSDTVIYELLSAFK